MIKRVRDFMSKRLPGGLLNRQLDSLIGTLLGNQINGPTDGPKDSPKDSPKNGLAENLSKRSSESAVVVSQVSKNSSEYRKESDNIEQLSAQNMSSSNNSSVLNYKSAGVDVEAGDALVDWLQAEADESQSQQMPHQDRVLSGIGGFASLFRADFPEMKKPCLVTCTDGVGTKVKLAAQFSRYDGVGQDLVAMCVNDLICTGGRPLLFLDYYAVAKLDLKTAKQFLNGVKKACVLSDSALVGGRDSRDARCLPQL